MKMSVNYEILPEARMTNSPYCKVKSSLYCKVNSNSVRRGRVNYTGVIVVFVKLIVKYEVILPIARCGCCGEVLVCYERHVKIGNLKIRIVACVVVWETTLYICFDLSLVSSGGIWVGST